MKTLLTTIITLIAFAASASITLAAQTAACQEILGGGETCRQSEKISLNKKVLNPQIQITPGQKFSSGQFIENVTANGRTYSPNSPVAFHLEVTNTSSGDLKDITITDTIPAQYMTFMTGDSNGKYDKATRKYTVILPLLKKDETRVVTIQLMTSRLEDLPQNNNPLCTINRSEVSSGRELSEDNATVCVRRNQSPTNQNSTSEQNPSSNQPQGQTMDQTKGGLPIFPQNQPGVTKNSPSTGPGLVLLGSLIPVGLMGLILRRKSSSIL